MFCTLSNLTRAWERNSVAWEVQFRAMETLSGSGETFVIQER